MNHPCLFPTSFLLLFALPLGAIFAAEPDAADVEFFEKKIRPVLVKHCYECHSAKAKEIKGGLRLDNRAVTLQGGDTGAALVPGKVGEGTLIAALRHETFEMPPKGKLPAAVIADFVKWIELGAPDPRQGEAISKRSEIDLVKGKQFWSFQPPKSVEPPKVKNAAWPRDDIDRFILARLEKARIEPAADADRVALVRRLYFDLVGLPPSPKEIDIFVNDDSPKAYENLIDRLLASRHFGERWGRHWLDIARYAESSGGGRTVLFYDAWRYRDYVIRALNDDKPFDRFVAEQIAGDMLPAETLQAKRDSLTALGFLMLGPINYELQDKELLRFEVIDEQIDVLGKAILGMSISCARCHDHKFDPIPTHDYYALTGILYSTKSLLPGNVSGFVERQLPLEPKIAEQLKRHQEEVAAIQAKLKPLQDELKKLEDQLAGKQGKFDPSKLPGIVIDDTQAKKTGAWVNSTSVQTYLKDGYLHDSSSGKGEKWVTYTPNIPAAGLYEVRVSHAASGNRANNTPVTIHHADGETTKRVDQTKTPAIDGVFVSLGQFRFKKGNAGSIVISNKGTSAHVIADAVQLIPPDASAVVKKKEKSQAEKQRIAQLQTQIAAKKKQVKPLADQLAALNKKAPSTPKVMGVQDQETTGDYHLLLRGKVRNLGPKVPRGFLQVTMPFKEGKAMPVTISPGQSGRLELARWLSSRDNPLTARVAVNRIWRHLFGAGIVRTPDNFGKTGELPSHGELLDHLALRFMDEGWSVKKMIRQIVLSRTYQLSTHADEKTKAADPENRLLARAGHRRLEAETIRDAILTVSGQLDLSAGGPSFDSTLKSEFNFKYNSLRRGIYVAALRNISNELFEVFDMANPNLVSGNRNTSTLSTQALYLMNSPFVMQQAQHAATRLLAVEGLQEKERLELAYRWTLGRPPSEEEKTLAINFLKGTNHASEKNNKADLVAWGAIFQTLFACVDFRYVD